MKRITIIFASIFFLIITGCSDKPQELYQTAALEEKQNNIKHAVQLYQEILKKYPKSEFAEKAKERLVELEKNK